MQNSDFPNLPKSWQLKTLAQVCTSTSSNITLKNIQDKKGDYPIYGASGVVSYVDFYIKENQSLGIVKDGAGIGRMFLLPPKASVIGTLHYVESNDDLNLKYLFYFLQSINLARYITGSAIPHIYFRDWKKEQIPIPPLEIQRRIVKRLDEAFLRIENGTKHLKSAKDNLAKYKQSLLKSAFNGTLTNDSLNGESANLPQGWTIKTLGEIAFVTKLAGFEYTKYIYPNLTNSGIPLFKGKNIQGNKLVLEFESHIPKTISNQLERSKLSKKCILTPYVGSIGNVAIFDGSFEAHLGSNVGKIEILNNYALEEYVFYFLQSSAGYLELTKHKKATAQESISISAIRDIKIPIPPLEIQKQIVAILERHFTSADKVSAYIDSCLSKAKQLKSSLLKSAFAGELV